MNKKLLILPVISALLLAGCTMGRTTKKKKKSSSVDVTSQSVTPSPTSGTPAPTPTSATPAPTPTSATPAPTPTSGTPAPTPTSGTSVIPPVSGWSSEELSVFNTNFGGIVPPYVEGGLDLENSELDKGVAYSQDMTETQANAYLTSLDSSWEFVQDPEEGDYYAKDTADGNAYVLIYSSYYEDDTSTFYIVYQYGEYEGGGGGGGDVPPAGESITISLEDIASTLGSSIYASADYSFTTDGVSFNATAGVGQKTANGSGQGNYYNEQGLMQFRKANHANGGGVVTVAEAVSKSTVTVHWYATYATEDSQYHPVVKVGDSVDAVSTSVACNEGTTLTGTLVEGVKEYSGNQDRDVYAYTTTYTISGHSYFSIGAPNSATYIKDIVIS